MSNVIIALTDDMRDIRVPACVHWTVDKVAAWIEELGFACYKECFKSNEITGRRLIVMYASALPRIGITDFEDIKTITKAIRDILYIEDPYWNRSITLPPCEDLSMYLESRSVTGVKSDSMSYSDFLFDNKEVKWQPPLCNQALLLPHT